MKTANQLTTAAQSKIASQQASPTPTTPAGRTACSTKEERKAAIQELVNRAFTRLEAIFPRTWRMSFSTGEMLQLAKRELALSMASWSSLPTREALDMTIEQIKLEGGNWPPSIAELCRQFKPSLADFGLPEPEVAFREACMHAGRMADHAWSHQAVMDATSATGSWDLKHCASDFDRNRLRKVFFAEYQALCNRLLEGGELDERVALLESDEMKGALRMAQEAGERQAQQEAEAFWKARGEAPPNSPEESISRLRGLLNEEDS